MEHESNAQSGTTQTRGADNKKNLFMALGAVVVILIVLVVANFGGALNGKGKKLTPDEARDKADKFVNAYLVSGTPATIASVTEYGDLYKMEVKVGDSTITSYMDKTGENFYPQGMNIAETSKTAAGANPTAAAPVAPANLTKAAKPSVELFVMSHCPYGTQAEKGIIPAIEALGNKVDFKIKFVNYIMHDKIESDHNTLQYCIDKVDSGKYFPFMKCFLKDGNADGCIAETGVNKSKVDKCITDTDKEFKITEKFTDKSKWANNSFPPYDVHAAENTKYGVQGSPTLVVNGQTVDSARSPQAFLTTICAGFENAPEECKKQLDTATPGPGFGEASATNTGGSNAACAPA